MNNPTTDAQRALFTALVNRVAADAWQNSDDKGFHTARLSDLHPDVSAIAALGLVASEVGEAIDAIRTAGAWRPAIKTPRHSELGEELADIVIRVFDLAHERKVDLGGAIVDKMAYNATRPMLHGKAI